MDYVDEIDRNDQTEYIEIILTDEDGNTYKSSALDYEWDSLKSYYEQFGDSERIEGEIYDRDGYMIGSFNGIEQMSTELKECVESINREYGGERSTDESGTYACYLNLTDPLIIDCKGANWDSIMDEGFVKVSARIHDLDIFIRSDSGGYVRDEIMTPDEIEERFGQSILDQILDHDWDNELAFDYHDFYSYYGDAFDPEEEGYPMEGNTRFWCGEAEAMGHDGVIFRNLMDNGPNGYGYNAGDVFVAFSSEQIKDICNLNPTENPDIRYSIIGEDEADAYRGNQWSYDNSYEAIHKTFKLWMLFEPLTMLCLARILILTFADFDIVPFVGIFGIIYIDKRVEP